MKTHHQIVIVGGGNAGLSAASQLLIKNHKLDIAIIEPSEKHYYQPAWTLVGAGTFDINETVKAEADYIPKGTKWVKSAVASFQPEQNQLTCSNGDEYTYDYLLVVPGIQLDFDKIKGLKETLGKNNVSCNYKFDYAPYTWEMIKNFKGGVAVFTNPNTPIKCGGAPHKIMYLATDYWRKQGILDKCEIHYVSGGGILFGVPEYAKTLQEVIDAGHIHTHFSHNVTSIDGPNHTISFDRKDAEGNMVHDSMKFDFCHVVPPQSAPDFVKNSPLADPNNPLGWVEVDKKTFRHARFANVYACGDVSNAPASKTGAAIRKQVPVVVDHMLADINKTTSTMEYDGYSACPIPTGYGKLMLAEFDYNNRPKMTFPFDQAVPRWSMWMLKKYVLPWLYWHRILSGRA